MNYVSVPSYPSDWLRCASQSRPLSSCRDTSWRRRCWWGYEGGRPLNRRERPIRRCQNTGGRGMGVSPKQRLLHLTPQELLYEGSYGAGVCQVQLSHLHLSFGMSGPNAGRRLLPFLHISARHDHPRPCHEERRRLEALKLTTKAGCYLKKNLNFCFYAVKAVKSHWRSTTEPITEEQYLIRSSWTFFTGGIMW